LPPPEEKKKKEKSLSKKKDPKMEGDVAFAMGEKEGNFEKKKVVGPFFRRPAKEKSHKNKTK